MNKNERSNGRREQNFDFFMIFLMKFYKNLDFSCFPRSRIHLLEWDESGTVGGADSWSTVSDWLVGDTVFTGVSSNHLGFDLNSQHLFTVVDTDDVSNHLWQDHNISEVGLNRLWPIQSTFNSDLFLVQLSDQVSVLLFKTSSEGSSVSRVGHGGEFFGAHFQEVVQVDSSVGELFEGSSFFVLDLLSELGSGSSGVGHDGWVSV